MFLNRCLNTETKRFLADGQLFIIGICLCFIWTVCTLGMIIVLFKRNEIEAAFMSFLLMIISEIVCLCAMPKWRIIVELNSEGISYKPTFKKKIVKKYSDFGYFYCASYTYYTQKKYIVFSQRRLNDYELTHINNVQVSDKLIKIKVRKGLKEEISPLLPPKYLSRIPKDFW